MADIAVTPAKVAPIDPTQSEIIAALPDETLALGDVVSMKSNGRHAKSAAGAAPTTKRAGVVLDAAGTRQGVSILKRGRCSGFDVSGLDYGALVYLSDTPGKLADAAGTTSVVVGTVVPMSDADKTKVVYFDFPWLT